MFSNRLFIDSSLADGRQLYYNPQLLHSNRPQNCNNWFHTQHFEVPKYGLHLEQSRQSQVSYDVLVYANHKVFGGIAGIDIEDVRNAAAGCLGGIANGTIAAF